MAGTKSIEKLRNVVIKGRDHGYKSATNYYKAMAGAINEIEREISERYMELPVDANGVPIHVGDLLKLGDTRSEVMAFEYRPHDKLPWSWLTKDGEWHNTAFTQHVKPRTIEDVLRDLLHDTAHYFPSDCEDDIARAAEEIRGLL